MIVLQNIILFLVIGYVLNGWYIGAVKRSENKRNDVQGQYVSNILVLSDFKAYKRHIVVFTAFYTLLMVVGQLLLIYV